MMRHYDIPVMILAGGRSSRFGSNKALAPLAGKPLATHVIERISLQTKGTIAVNAQDTAAFSHLGLPIVPDQNWQGEGPLSGIMTAMKWADCEAAEMVLTVSVDAPFLPIDLIAKLQASGAPSIAACKERLHPVIGLWSASRQAQLDAYLQSGERSAHGWARHCGANATNFEEGENGADPFWNINTSEEMARAELMLKRRPTQ